MFRKELNLSLRDFAAVFDVSVATVHKIETNKIANSEVIKRLDIYRRFPEVALFEAQNNAGRINEKTKNRLIPDRHAKAARDRHLKAAI